ncbi:hypothetical protein [Magnetospirillum sp. SS-4]|uniref:hypothetical protein n=1 Tax=Magnetospirillum sp. SS-4 TaxID=2681465 RepID=UPI001383BC78|nr:hypothetical protein [Magnetospirillum sp. SS-4]CAA7622451.1 hypothetical protein MTBSS4_350027 [Magnetospirillum sp. SS-4]
MDIDYEKRRAAKQGVTIDEWLKIKADKNYVPKPSLKDNDDIVFDLTKNNPEKIVFQVRFGKATVNAPITVDEYNYGVRDTQTRWCKSGPVEDRRIIKDCLRKLIMENHHLKAAGGSQVVHLTSWLFSSMENFRPVSGMIGIIEISRLPGKDNWNFRFMAMEPDNGPTEAEPEEVTREGSHSEKSPHPRTGHWRHYQNGKQVWIRDTFIHPERA